jgi:hypothetical protein
VDHRLSVCGIVSLIGVVANKLAVAV